MPTPALHSATSCGVKSRQASLTAGVGQLFGCFLSFRVQLDYLVKQVNCSLPIFLFYGLQSALVQSLSGGNWVGEGGRLNIERLGKGTPIKNAFNGLAKSSGCLEAIFGALGNHTAHKGFRRLGYFLIS